MKVLTILQDEKLDESEKLEALKIAFDNGALDKDAFDLEQTINDSLLECAKNNYVNITDWLIKENDHITISQLVLYQAFVSGSLDMIKYLSKIPSKFGLECLDSEREDIKIFKVINNPLMNIDLDSFHRTQNGGFCKCIVTTPLDVSVLYGHAHCVEWLLQNGAQCNYSRFNKLAKDYQRALEKGIAQDIDLYYRNLPPIENKLPTIENMTQVIDLIERHVSDKNQVATEDEYDTDPDSSLWSTM